MEGVPPVADRGIGHDGNADNPRSVVVASDHYYIAYFNATDVGVVDATAYKIFADRREIVIMNAMGRKVQIFDMLGRTLKTVIPSSDAYRIYMPHTSAYVVRVDNERGVKVVTY